MNYLKQSDVVEIKEDTGFPPVKWMKHDNGGWYVSPSGDPKRWHNCYSEEESYARTNFFNGEIGSEIFLTKFG
jgi:hypothetical protein